MTESSHLFALQLGGILLSPSTTAAIMEYILGHPPKHST